MKISVFWDKQPRTLMDTYWRFGVTCSLHLQDRLAPLPWKWRQHLPAKRRCLSTKLHSNVPGDYTDLCGHHREILKSYRLCASGKWVMRLESGYKLCMIVSRSLFWFQRCWAFMFSHQTATVEYLQMLRRRCKCIVYMLMYWPHA
jgi:hypothetical protein